MVALVTSPPAVVAESATKVFAQAGVVAFRDLNLTVADHETVCIVGPSGCGKTTFLRCAAGLAELTDGQLLLHGQPIRRVPEGVALVFQHFGLLP
jgi:ABC-type Fe3+/spermidine/putrescine transport system ATPase subunit